MDLKNNKEITIPQKEIISKELPDLKEEEKTLAIKLTKFNSIKIADEMMNYFPTCVILKFTLKKMLDSIKKCIKELNKEIYEAYCNYLYEVIEKYKVNFILKRK